MTNELSPNKLAQAAKTACALITMMHETMWNLYPEEVLYIYDHSIEEIAQLLTSQLEQEACSVTPTSATKDHNRP